MSVYVAFYKGRPKPGSPWRERLKYLFDGAIRLLTRSPYSHCELPSRTPPAPACISASRRQSGMTRPPTEKDGAFFRGIAEACAASTCPCLPTAGTCCPVRYLPIGYGLPLTNIRATVTTGRVFSVLSCLSCPNPGNAGFAASLSPVCCACPLPTVIPPNPSINSSRSINEY